MKINKIIIQNFQKHSNLSLTFNDNINVITGLTDTGKSGIFRAMNWVFNFSNISENDYRKEGTKQTSVKVWLDNEFQVERIRSNSINRYILSKVGTEDKIFDNFGKETPEEIANVFEISTIDVDTEHINLNFSNQDQLNFLFDSTYSDTFKAKLFNKLTGNEVLDDLFKTLNGDNRRLKRAIKETEENLSTQEEQLCECSTQYKALKKKLSNISDKYIKIKEELKIYEHLNELSERINQHNIDKKQIRDNIKKIVIVSDNKIKKLNEETKKLQRITVLHEKLDNINTELKIVEKTQKNEINVDFKKLTKLNNEITAYSKIMSFCNAQKNAVKQIHEQKALLTELERETQLIWEKNPQCPLCGKNK